jgi:hypothetical protein
MANVMAPATDSIMGSLPRAKAGVGSAINDTTRQTGGAFGVAVLGSLLASRYSGRMASILGKDAPLLPAVKNNVAQAHGFATKTLGHVPALQAHIIDASNRAFVSGFHYAAIVGVAVLLLTAAAVLRFLPSRPPELDVNAPLALPDDAHVPANVGR